MLLNDLDICCMKYVSANLSRSCYFNVLRESKCLKQLTVNEKPDEECGKASRRTLTLLCALSSFCCKEMLMTSTMKAYS